jgi:hypothetical protein
MVVKINPTQKLVGHIDEKTYYTGYIPTIRFCWLIGFCLMTALTDILGGFNSSTLTSYPSYVK